MHLSSLSWFNYKVTCLPAGRQKPAIAALLLLTLLTACSNPGKFDVLIKNGTIYDGSGSVPFVGDIAMNADTIAAIGDLKGAKGRQETDVHGLAVTPGFINMLSWATTSLIHDGRSQSDIRQGVTLEVMGEGSSMGPLNEDLRKEMTDQQGDIKYEVPWTTLGEYLEYLEKKGVSPNVASFIGNATVRQYVLGYEDRPQNEKEMEQMKELVKQAMEEGAMGISSALIYVPSSYASTEELIELVRVVSHYNGMYISHIRSESGHLLEAMDEFIRIVKEAGLNGEIYHFKASAKQNWHKMDAAIDKIKKARAEGLHITTDMYNYPASSTGLNTVLPQWAIDGGINETLKRFNDPVLKQKAVEEVHFPCTPDSILLVGFKNEKMKHLTGKSLGEIAKERGISPAEAVPEIILEDSSRIQCVFFTMSEQNLRKKVVLPFMSFCSDAGSIAPEGVFLKSSPHPRTYGSFARLLRKYVREEKIVPLEEAVRRLSHLPAENLKIRKRGMLKKGYYGDVVVFDPASIQDHATFKNPHQYATGVKYVWVNGVQVLKNGEHTGATPGRVVRGPGWKVQNQ